MFCQTQHKSNDPKVLPTVDTSNPKKKSNEKKKKRRTKHAIQRPVQWSGHGINGNRGQREGGNELLVIKKKTMSTSTASHLQLFRFRFPAAAGVHPEINLPRGQLEDACGWSKAAVDSVVGVLRFFFFHRRKLLSRIFSIVF